ncbi:MAG: hypothetical protein ACLRRU_02505 [Faecalibacterium sp.]
MVAVDAHSSIRSLSDLAGKTVAVQSTGEAGDLSQRLRPRIPRAVEVLA